MKAALAGLACCALFALGCSESAVAPTQSVRPSFDVDNDWVPLLMQTTLCGQQVTVEGETHFFMQDQGTSFVMHQNAHGVIDLGVGDKQHAPKYEWNVEGQWVDVYGNGANEYTNQLKVHMTARWGQFNMSATTTWHTTFDANGNVRSEIQDFDAICK